MSLTLRAGVSWCICARQAVFLDLGRDRYFCLPEALDEAFQRWVAGGTIDPAARGALVAAGVAEPGPGEISAAAAYPAATRDLAAGARRGPIAKTLAAVSGQLRARRRLKRRPLARIVSELASGTVDAGPKVDEAVLRSIANAFVSSGLLLRAADQCLPRAIAAAELCRRHGQAVALIFGVRLNPFAAHSWVQAGDAVVVGDLEQVRLYTPILVVR
ncbi:lasso peptide biosynthesis B2 protein [Sphingomonas psychrotolerans]|uniref:Lasso peptide biosynthesis B2 protein n=1 Tax=Sphingomonas psychrotolerans TaxID=1327635 RepID=A0ABU3N9I5_9SPHN|nr:lasso peptide biosynthesis B2 protein [Sphingomonas psychrotolerans]MDT8760539.1 lasso peptide biosynthesis B2 protein [Sphingomonas psychrotolerans]